MNNKFESGYVSGHKDFSKNLMFCGDNPPLSLRVSNYNNQTRLILPRLAPESAKYFAHQHFKSKPQLFNNADIIFLIRHTYFNEQ